MMKKPTLLILILTSIAPISVVYAGVLLDAGDMLSAIMYAAAAVVVALACFILLKFASKWQKPQPSELSDISTKDGESLAFLVGYALPLLAVDHVKPTGWFGIATFAVVITSTLFQQQMFHVNPAMALLGYRFYSARDNKGAQVLIVSRSPILSPGVLQTLWLSDYLGLHIEK